MSPRKHFIRRWILAAALAPALLGASVIDPPLWNRDRETPLRVWVQASPNKHAVRLAVTEWNAQRLPLRFRLVSDSSTADVRVVWIERFDEPISGRTTCVDEGGRHIVRADVVLARQHSDGQVLSMEESRVLAVHELGHALGLEHVNDSTSVMSPRVRVRAISSEDRRRAMRLYSADARK